VKNIWVLNFQVVTCKVSKTDYNTVFRHALWGILRFDLRQTVAANLAAKDMEGYEPKDTVNG
jgi:hypothetical protein